MEVKGGEKEWKDGTIKKRYYQEVADYDSMVQFEEGWLQLNHRESNMLCKY